MSSKADIKTVYFINQVVLEVKQFDCFQREAVLSLAILKLAPLWVSQQDGSAFSPPPEKKNRAKTPELDRTIGGSAVLHAKTWRKHTTSSLNKMNRWSSRKSVFELKDQLEQWPLTSNSEVTNQFIFLVSHPFISISLIYYASARCAVMSC